MFDPAAAWDALPLERQRAIGIAALVLAIARDEPHVNEAWNWHAAEIMALDQLQRQYSETDIPGLSGAPPPDLAAIGVRMCRSCGCTDEYACEGGCGWAGPDICDRCIPRRGRRR